MKQNAQFRPTQDVVFESVEGGTVLLNFATNTYYTLNETGAYVWTQLAAQPLSCEELVARVQEAFEVSLDVCARDVHSIVAALVEAGLLQEWGESRHE